MRQDHGSANTSWVVRRKATGEVLFETFNVSLVSVVNREAYEVVEIGEYLGSINRANET